MALAIALVLQTQPGGLVWMAPVCSSWVFLCLGSSGRSKLDVLGNTERKFVRDANLMVSRCCILMRLAVGLGLTYILEQPASSLLVYHPRMQQLAEDTQMYVICFPMALFGSRTTKQTKLYSNASWIAEFPNAKEHHTEYDAMADPNGPAGPTYQNYFDSAGNLKVTGGVGLSETQRYTLARHMPCGNHRPWGSQTSLRGSKTVNIYS